MAELVVGPAAVRVGEDLVGLGGLLELLLGLGVVAVDVRVKLARERSERLLQLGVLGGSLDAEHLVGVAGHRVSLGTELASPGIVCSARMKRGMLRLKQ